LLFNSPEEWLGHMQWQHTIVWNCQALGHEEAIFNTEHEFQNHIRSSHPGSFTESQLLQLTQQAALPAPNVFAMLAISFANGDSLTATANACPICHKFQVVSSSAVGNIEEPASAHQQQLQHHILEHLETIALLSLPDKEYVGLAESNVRQSSHDKLSIIMKWATLPSLSFDDDHSTRTAAAQIIDDELPHFEDLDYEESWDMVLQEVKPNFPEPDKDSLLQGLRDYMLSVKGSGLSTTPATLHHTSERFLQLSAEFPGLARYSEAQRISILLDEAGCRDQILETVKSGINDLWLPINEEYWPSSLSLSLLWKLKDLQQYFLLNSFTITDSAQWPSEHANLNTNAISWPQIPNNLEFGRFLGAGGGAQVAEVKGPNNGIFALKRFVRATSARRAKLQMQYIKSEIDILRRIRHRHYVTLVGSYTDYKFIGILMHPVADGDLEWFLNDVVTGSKDELLLAGFFGCLATALMDLHYKWRVRHKDIKPRNILVIRNRKSILLTDFGIALDWGDTGRTTTNQEKMRSPIYCAPEVAKDEPRNSMSDVWSLGCVFLEMAAVLKGKSRMFIQDILTKCGSPSYCNNPEGIQQVISELSSAKTKWNNDPLLWAEQMLKERKEDRPSSRELMLMILQVKGHGSQLYCGDCCKPDISLDSETVDIAPTSGSDIEHDTASSEGEAECGVPPSEGQEFTKVQQLMIQAAIDHALTSGTSFEDVNEMTEYLRSGGISEYLLGDRYLQARTNIWYNAIGAYKESMRHATTSAN
jgi:serine/threonine protein kinase